MAGPESARAWAKLKRANSLRQRALSILGGCRSTTCFPRCTRFGREPGLLEAPERILKRGQDCIPIGDETDIRALEDERVGVVVDGDDCSRALEAASVIRRAAHSDRDIESRIDRFAGQ